MTASPPITRDPPGEEIANFVTHGIGLILAIIGSGALAYSASVRGDGWHLVSCMIFGAALIVLYSASTLYHATRNPRFKNIFRIIDHSAILLLIAGTYTPFTLVSLRGPWGWSIFGIVWGLATVGLVLELTTLRRFRVALITLYVIMGWVIIVAIKPMLNNLAPGGLWLLLTGGMAYTGGIVFYSWNRLPYNHAIWHVFVLTGSTLHFFAVLFYVIPAGVS